MLPPIPDAVVLFGLIAIGFIADILAFYYHKKADRYKGELDLLKQQGYSDDSNLTKPQISAKTSTTTKTTSRDCRKKPNKTIPGSSSNAGFS